jgi:hypothetical protein
VSDKDEPNEFLEGDIVLYSTPTGAVRIKVLYESETFWLNGRVGNSPENPESSAGGATGNVAREIAFHNLDAIISVGYRVNSVQARPPRNEGSSS